MVMVNLGLFVAEQPMSVRCRHINAVLVVMRIRRG
jgi:hypothetical protein